MKFVIAVEYISTITRSSWTVLATQPFALLTPVPLKTAADVRLWNCDHSIRDLRPWVQSHLR